eukprot:m.8626 g.8626  ORF g.8626 m.8626 type:complete len:345 (-) comp3932_c0_seq1:163-1197(-)
MSASNPNETKAVAGSFQRGATSHHDVVSKEKDAKYPAAAGRYHLYISYACPWANRCLAVLKLKGLEEAISVSVVAPTWQRTKPDITDDTHCGWVFRDPAQNPAPLQSPAGNGELAIDSACTPDHINGLTTIRDVYQHAGSGSRVFSVPIFYDKQTKSIVNNESAEIVRFLNSEFNEFAKNPDLDLYPEELRDEIDAVNEWVYPTINNGVYRSGFAKTQAAYELAVQELTASIHRVEDILSKQRYIASKTTFTEADLRLFMTLVRYDEVYVVYFKCNGAGMLAQHENIRNWMREMYSLMGEAINMKHIREHYFTSHPSLNHYAIVPIGPNVVDDLKKPHDRARFD